MTGATSGATGVIASQTDAGATGTLRLTSVTGNFIDDEIITDTMTGSATVNGYGRATVKITTPFAYKEYSWRSNFHQNSQTSVAPQIQAT